MHKATGDYLLFMDDDDMYLPGALNTVRHALKESPGLPHLFRMRRDGHFHDELPRVNTIRVGEVSTQMICFPNDPQRIGTWGTRYEGDFDFIASTLSLYPADVLVWRHEALSVWRPDPDGVWSTQPWPTWWSHEPKSWDEAVFLEVVCRDDYRVKTQHLVGARIVDIGAHVGSFAYAVKARGASVVHCYEPEAVSRAHLERNAAHLIGVQVYPEAVGDLVLDMEQPNRPLRKAPTIDLNTAVKRIGHAQLVKLDCEGGEWPALSSFTRWVDVDAIEGEWHECEWNIRRWGPPDLAAIFASHHWQVELAPSDDLPGRGLFFAVPNRGG